MKAFRKKWNYVAVEDDIYYMSKQAKAFVTAFKNMLKRTLSPFEITLVSFKAGHYECRGFVEKGGKYLYLHYNIPRYGEKINFQANDSCHGVLYRTAEGPEDFRGGNNQFSSIDKIADNIIRMLA